MHILEFKMGMSIYEVIFQYKQFLEISEIQEYSKLTYSILKKQRVTLVSNVFDYLIFIQLRSGINRINYARKREARFPSNTDTKLSLLKNM